MNSRSSQSHGPKRSRKRLSQQGLSSRPAVKVLFVTGMPAAGKEEFVQVAAGLGFSIVRMGDVVRDEARRRGLPITDAAVGGMAHEERLAHGFGIWAERTLPRLKGERIIVDGLRGKAELDVFRRALGDGLVVLAIHASRGTRYARVKRRLRADDAMSLETFKARDERELGWGLGDVIAAADLMIVNEGSLEQFRAEAKALLERIHG